MTMTHPIIIIKVYRDSEPQCIVGNKMGQFAMQCMLSCTTRARIAYTFVWVQQRPLYWYFAIRDKPYSLVIIILQ